MTSIKCGGGKSVRLFTPMKGQNDTLFAIGPVEMEPEIAALGAQKLPYFRTEEFSQLMLGIGEKFKVALSAPSDSEAVLLTASGTGAMEAAVINVFDRRDKLLVVVGGAFGERFWQICSVYGLNA